MLNLILLLINLICFLCSCAPLDNNELITIKKINHQNNIDEQCLETMDVEFSFPEEQIRTKRQIQPLNYRPIDYWPENNKINMSICYFGRVYQLLLTKKEKREKVDFGVLLYTDNNVTDSDWKIPNIFGHLTAEPNSECQLGFYGVLEKGILLGTIYNKEMCQKLIDQQIRKATKEFSANLLVQHHQQIFTNERTKNAIANNDADGKIKEVKWSNKNDEFKKDTGLSHSSSTHFHSFIVDEPYY